MTFENIKLTVANMKDIVNYCDLNEEVFNYTLRFCVYYTYYIILCNMHCTDNFIATWCTNKTVHKRNSATNTGPFHVCVEVRSSQV